MCDRNLEASSSCAGKDRKKYWTEHEVIHMLYLIEEKHILELLDGKRYRNSDIFHELAKAMAESGYSRTPEQLRSKWKSLKRDFYEAKRKNNKSGSERSDFAFYDEMASLLEKRPSSLLVEQGVDSAACEDASVEIEDDSQESESTGDDVRFTVSSDNSTTFSVSATSRPEKRRRTHTSRGAYAGALAAFAQDVRANHLEVLKEQQKWLSEEFERDRQWERELLENMQVHSFLIANLAIGDLFMGVYLLIIGSADTYYRGVYSVHDRDWRSSGLCHTAGFLSTFSSEFSVYTLTVIALDRFLVILFPFHVRTMKMKKTRLLMAVGWLGAAFLSGLPFIHISYFKNFYGRSGVCLALHITPEKYHGWEYSVFVFLFLNLASFSVIAVGYTSIFVIARTTQQAAQMNRKTAESAVIARRMTLIVATDAACWMPIICLGILSLAGMTVPPQVFAWIAVFVLPLNAAINPILYTISTTPFLEPTLKRLKTLKRSCRLSLTTEQNHLDSSVTALEHQQEYNLHGKQFVIDTGHSVGNDKYKKKQHQNCKDSNEEDGEHFFSVSECQQHLDLTSQHCCTEAASHHSSTPVELVMSTSQCSERCIYTDVHVQFELLPLQQMAVDK